MEHNVRLAGQGTSPGLVAGRAFVHKQALDALSLPRRITREQISVEQGSIERALEAVRADLQMSAMRLESLTGPALSSIFEAHLTILQDSSLRDEILERIERDLVGASQAAAEVFRHWEEKFRLKPQTMLQDRADDLADLEGRLLRELAGVKTTALERMPPGRVLVAHRLYPSETVALPRRSVAGIILEFGGPGSHAALLARALGVPTVAQIHQATALIHDREQVIVDGYTGEVILRPDAQERTAFLERSRERLVQLTRAKELAALPARTIDGTEVSVMANIGCREDGIAAVENGADGVGLYRMEQFYLSRTTPPSAQELLGELMMVFAPLKGKEITVRLLDLGADKPVPFLNFPAEDDPFLGCRGVRLLLRYPELLDCQFRALLALSKTHRLRILVPMITLPEEMDQLRKLLRSVADQEGVGRLPPFGAMIETPAAALTVREIVRHSDFLSVGTNDLTQFTMAAGRENPLVNHYFVESHPAVLRLLRMVHDEAGDTPVCICGELGSQLDCIETLVRMGSRSLSVAPPLVPWVKEAVRGCRTGLFKAATSPDDSPEG